MAPPRPGEHDLDALARAMQRPAPMGRKRAGVLLLTLASAAPAACGGVERAPAEVAGAVREVSAAGEAGAREDPRASYFLELARRELYRARVQARVGDAEGARGWAARAGADAEVARMMAIETATRGAAQRTEDQAEELSRAIDGSRGAAR